MCESQTCNDAIPEIATMAERRSPAYARAPFGKKVDTTRRQGAEGSGGFSFTSLVDGGCDGFFGGALSI